MYKSIYPQAHDQAHGLQGWDLLPSTRVIPVVAMPDSSVSLELLWALEGGCHDQGHAVAMVDGMNGLRPEDAQLGLDAVLQRWISGVTPGGVVLVHAPLDALAVLLCDSVARPLVAMGQDRASAVRAYNAIKVLAQAAGLQPVLVQVQSTAARGQMGAARALQETCAKHLQMVPAAWLLEYYDGYSGPRHPIQEAGLLKVLDSALTVEDARSRHDDVSSFPSYRQHPADRIIGVSDVHRQRHA